MPDDDLCLAGDKLIAAIDEIVRQSIKQGGMTVAEFDAAVKPHEDEYGDFIKAKKLKEKAMKGETI